MDEGTGFRRRTHTFGRMGMDVSQRDPECLVSKSTASLLPVLGKVSDKRNRLPFYPSGSDVAFAFVLGFNTRQYLYYGCLQNQILKSCSYS